MDPDIRSAGGDLASAVDRYADRTDAREVFALFPYEELGWLRHPLAFFKVSVTVDESIRVPRELSNQEFEALLSRVEILLRNEAD